MEKKKGLSLPAAVFTPLSRLTGLLEGRMTVILFLSSVFFAVSYNLIVAREWMLDDAFISFRYALHWAQGLGPVYNPGEAPVEGYTNFLWVALLALGARLGGDIVVVSRLLGGVAGLLTLALVFNSRRFIRTLDREVPILATLFLATFCIFLPWPTSGMETTLFGFLLMFSLLLHFSTLWEAPSRLKLMGLGVVLALTVMTRPEGLLVAGLVLADQALESLLKRRFQVIVVLAAFLVVFLPWFFWRWYYYSALLPNTFYAKVGATDAQVRRGWKYFWSMYAPARPLIYPAALAVLAPWAWLRRYERYYLLPLLLVLYTAYIILVGGDGLPAFRFFAPLTAPLCLLAAIGVRRVVPVRPLILALALLILGLNLHQAFTSLECYQLVATGDYVQKKGTLVGQWLLDRAPEGTVIATNTAGTIPYYSKLKTIDMLGLNDRHIAHRDMPFMGHGYAGHEKGDGAYVLGLKPDIIQFSSSSGSERPSVEFIGDNEIFKTTSFQEEYSLRDYSMADGSPLFLYVRKDSPFGREEADVVFDDFESGSYTGWTLEGDCFGEAPAAGTLPDQYRVQGYEGDYLINTMYGGKETTGRAVSRPFVIGHNYIQFLLGGGYHPGEAGISLLVDGSPVLTREPSKGYCLLPYQWDVSAYHGKEAQIEITDMTKAPMGLLLVDHIVFSNTNRSVQHYARRHMHPRFGLLPWLLGGAGLWCLYAARRRRALSLGERLLPWALLILFIVLYRTAWVCDDACITMRTVDNFTRGLGLTWNNGERVQAYTHPLWMFLLSAVYYFSNDLYLTLIVVSIVVSMAAVCIAVRDVAASPAAALAGVFVLMFSHAFTEFSTSGLENPLTYLLLAVFMVVYLRRQWTPGVLFLLTLCASCIVLNRMDLALLAAPPVIWMWLSMRNAKATWALVLGGVPFFAWLLFSLIYYGVPFPNTAYAKLGTGIAPAVLLQQAVHYYKHTLAADPITLPLIGLAVAWPFWVRNGKYGALSVGIILYLVYIYRIGGDFMEQRFFAPPFFMAVLVLMRMAGRVKMSGLVPATAVLLLAGCCAPNVPLLSGANFGSCWESPVNRHGICNERQYYYHATGMLHWRPGKLMPGNGWAEGIVRHAMLDQPTVLVHGMMGFHGYFCGPKVFLIDQMALSDPLLARLPAMKAQIFRTGHHERHIPEGYLETALTGRNVLKDPNLALFYDKIRLITRGPLFTRERWKAILDMNLGRYDHLIDWEYYKNKLPDPSALL